MQIGHNVQTHHKMGHFFFDVACKNSQNEIHRFHNRVPEERLSSGGFLAL